MDSNTGAARFDNLKIEQTSIARNGEETCDEGVFDIDIEVTWVLTPGRQPWLYILALLNRPILVSLQLLNLSSLKSYVQMKMSQQRNQLLNQLWPLRLPRKPATMAMSLTIIRLFATMLTLQLELACCKQRWTRWISMQREKSNGFRLLRMMEWKGWFI